MNFLIKLLAYSALLYAIYFFAEASIPVAFHYPHVHYLFLFFIGLMALFNWWIFRPISASRSIVTRYMSATTGKFLLCLAVLAVYVMINKSQAVMFTIHFLALYLLYTFFEVAILYTAFRNKYSKTS